MSNLSYKKNQKTQSSATHSLLANTTNKKPSSLFEESKRGGLNGANRISVGGSWHAFGIYRDLCVRKTILLLYPTLSLHLPFSFFTSFMFLELRHGFVEAFIDLYKHANPLHTKYNNIEGRLPFITLCII